MESYVLLLRGWSIYINELPLYGRFLSTPSCQYGLLDIYLILWVII